MGFIKHIITFTVIVFSLSLTLDACAFSCDRNFHSVEMKENVWGYYPIFCELERPLDTGMYSYFGDLNDRIEVGIRKGDIGFFKIALILDTHDVDPGKYAGELDLYYEGNSSSFVTLPVKINVGEEDVEDMRLTCVDEDGRMRKCSEINFLLENDADEECIDVTVKNTGNVVLSDLETWVNGWDDNCNWVRINELDVDEFGVGETETLRVCVNNRDNCSGWSERETVVEVETHEVREKIKVRLLSDVEGHWEQEYDKIKKEYDFLWGTYRREHAYMIAWRSLNKTHTFLKENYTLLERGYGNLSARYEELYDEYMTLSNYSSKLNDSCEEGISRLENYMDSVEELSEQLEERDTMLLLFEQRLSGENNKSSANETIQGMIGNIVRNPYEAAPYLGFVAVAALIGFAFIGAITVRNRRTQKTQEKAEASPAGTDPFETHNGADTEADRELQKEKLRKLILEKMAEKSPNESN